MAKRSAQTMLIPELQGRKRKRTSDVHVAVDHYHDLFNKRFGFSPIVGGKECNLLKKLVTAWGINEVLTLLDTFFTTSDSRITRGQYTVGELWYQAHRLRINESEQDERTRRNIEQALRATQRR